MSLADDARWIVDALDMIVIGGLPTYPKTWTTKTGERIARLVIQLAKARHEEWSKRMNAEHIADSLTREVNGLRDTNERLTAEVEMLRGQASTQA